MYHLNMVNNKEYMMTLFADDLENEANRIAKKAIGLPFTIKLADSGRANKVTVSGTIVDCCLGYVRSTSTRRQAVFKVTMECGPNKVRREFHVLKVPQ
jgi:hypothetical protein